MSVGWQRLRVTLLERLALLDWATREGISEEELLSRIIREAVWRECARQGEIDAKARKGEVSHDPS